MSSIILELTDPELWTLMGAVNTALILGQNNLEKIKTKIRNGNSEAYIIAAKKHLDNDITNLEHIKKYLDNKYMFG